MPVCRLAATAACTGTRSEGLSSGSMADDHSQEMERLIRENMGFVHALATRYAPVPDLAQDVTQQVFLEFLKKQRDWDLSKDIRPLLSEMTRIVARRSWHQSCQHMTSQMRHLAEHVRQLAEASHIEPIQEEETAALKLCLERLPERSRLLVRARYYLGANSIEIADRLGMTPTAVRRALFRLRQTLRVCVGRRLKGQNYDLA
jgi:RNA polymerase sigma-70 factor, ECF subfamily